jgi:uncharacterized protein YlxW (UPF0749 family)
MSLLLDVMAHAVDEGYLDAAKRKATDGTAAPAAALAAPSVGTGRRRARVVAAVVLASAGTLFAISAITTERGASAANRARAQLVLQVEQQTTAAANLQEQVESMKAELVEARTGTLSTSDRLAGLATVIRELEPAQGAVAVEGPGVEVVLNDALPTGNASVDSLGVVLDRDLQAVVNALFANGAEAIAINGQRLTDQTTIREAGSAILVGSAANFQPLTPPYLIDAIGPPELGGRFSASATGQQYTTWSQVYGLRFTVADRTRLTLPSAANLVVRYAKPLDTP